MPPGDSVDTTLGSFRTALDVERGCLLDYGYARGTEFIATFCWSRKRPLSVTPGFCENVPFRYGDPVVTLTVTPVEEDDAGALDPDQDGGTR